MSSIDYKQNKIKEFMERNFKKPKLMMAILFVYLLLLLLTFIVDWRIGFIHGIFSLAIIALFMGNYDQLLTEDNDLTQEEDGRSLAQQTDLLNDIQNIQHDVAMQLPIGMMLYEKGRVRWLNPSFQQIFGKLEILGNRIENFCPDLKAIIEADDPKADYKLTIFNRTYQVYRQDLLQAVYLLDISQQEEILNLRQFDQLVFGYFYIDDYDELVHAMDDQQAAEFESNLIKELNEWASQYDVFMKRIEDEMFLMLLNRNILHQLEENKFKDLEAIKEKSYTMNIPLFVSLGIAYSDDERFTIESLAQQAQLNLNLALGRGGDQVVVNSTNGRARFYGGSTNPDEKRSNVRAKLVYQALESAIKEADQVFIAGHKYPDLDAIGSAIGVYRIVKHLKKPTKIIVNEDEFNFDILQLMELPQIKNQIDTVFTDLETAKAQVTPESLIIMVDHHRPSLSGAGDLVMNHTVVIIDHHRRSEEFPPHSVLTYIEPNASSASELVTEFFNDQYQSSMTLNQFEATVLLAGIIVDTNNFKARTGSRTFDAASYLKSRGANTATIQELLKEDFSFIVKRNHLLESAQITPHGIAVAKSKDGKVVENVLAAQAADILLSVKKVRASFVIYQREVNVVGISARSLGDVNVQLILEKMGGGGHLSNAATQLKDVSIDDAYHQLMKIIEDESEEVE